MKEQVTVTGDQINQVLRLVFGMTIDENVQCTILARAFVASCKASGVPSEIALRVIDQLFDEDLTLLR